MFAYCGNNPVCYIDTSGDFPLWLAIGAGIACLAAIGADHYLAKNYPDGVEYREVYQKDDLFENVYTAGRIAYAEGNGFEFSQTNGFTICDFKCGMAETSYGTECTRVSFFNAFTANVAMAVDWSGMLAAEISALLSIYSANAETTITLPYGTIELSGAVHVGAVGSGFELDLETLRFGAIMPGLIPGVVFEWDLDYDAK